MSITNRHTLVSFVSGKSAALHGQRLAKVGYKSTKAQTAKYPNVCVSVPPVDKKDIVDNVFQLTDHIRAMLETAQDGIIRSLYESADGAMIGISDDDISISACISYMEAAENGSRLTKELLGAWFDTQLSENLFIAFAEKLGFTDITEEVVITVNRHVAAHKAMITALSGGKTSYNHKQCKGLLFDLSLCAVEDDTCGKLEKRLNKMMADAEIAVDALMLD